MATKPHRYKSEFARRHYDEGYSEGHDEGYSEGHDEGYSEGHDEGYSEGKVEAGVEVISTVLSARGITVSKETHARITECMDLDQMESWVKRAVTADSVNDLFD